MKGSTETAVLVAAALVLAPGAALACASCACGDPTLTVMGVEKPFAGRLRLALEARTGDAGQGSPELRTRDSRLDLGASWAVSSRLLLAARLPLVRRDVARPDLSSAQATSVGDAELAGRLVVWEDRPSLPRALLSLTAGAKLPTGPRVAGDLDVQPGTGSLDPLAGVAFALFGGDLSLYASAIAYLPSRGFDGMRAGPSLRAGVTGQWQATSWLAPRLGVDSRLDGRSEVGGMTEADTGGTTVFASPGVVVALGEDLLLQTTVRVPVVTDLVGDQRFGPLVELGAVLDI